MDLIRLGAAQFQKKDDSVYRDQNRGTIGVFFRNFGHGTDRTNDYKVELSWRDVEAFIFEFAIMDEAKALELQAVQKLAKAIESLGWSRISN
jgi:hypothetical protein